MQRRKWSSKAKKAIYSGGCEYLKKQTESSIDRLCDHSLSHWYLHSKHVVNHDEIRIYTVAFHGLKQFRTGIQPLQVYRVLQSEIALTKTHSQHYTTISQHHLHCNSVRTECYCHFQTTSMERYGYIYRHIL